MAALIAFVRKLVRGVSLLLLFMLIVTPLAQVIMRGVFTLPFSGAEEMARYFLICLCFVAASYVTLDGGQIRMEEVQAFLPSRWRWLTQMTIEAMGVVFFGFICACAVITISRNLDNQTATLEMPFPIFMAPLALGALLLMLETLAVLVRLIRAGHADDKTTNLT
jgi:TRAP-type C4-dicarboxylate transport system permease small subunit